MSEFEMIGTEAEEYAQRLINIQERAKEEQAQWLAEFPACDERCRDIHFRGNGYGKVSSPKGIILCPHMTPDCWAAKSSREEKAHRIKTGLKHLGVGKIYSEVNFSNSKPTPFISKAQVFFNKGDLLPRCLILSGGPGCGKTHAAVTVLRAYLEFENSDSGYYSASYSYAAALLNKIRFAEIRDKESLVESVSCCPLLILDDLGTESKSEFGLSVLDEIIYHREQDRLPTIITTNKGKDEWKAAFGERIGDRLLGEWGMGVESGKPSMRKREGKEKSE